jgi:hypothetical protein
VATHPLRWSSRITPPEPQGPAGAAICLRTWRQSRFLLHHFLQAPDLPLDPVDPGDQLRMVIAAQRPYRPLQYTYSMYMYITRGGPCQAHKSDVMGPAMKSTRGAKNGGQRRPALTGREEDEG